MLKRVLAFFATALLSVGVLSVASPAQAAINGCPQSGGYICLYDWINYGGGRWQISAQNAWDAPSSCINLTQSSFTTGQPVYDQAASLQITAATNSDFIDRRWLIYDWINCNDNGPRKQFYVDGTAGTSNLSYISKPQGPAGDQNWYESIASISMCEISLTCPPWIV
ncbi:peptidase inhibitor family I36 protein [Actinoplanes sp. URMC 104]|uniref:peptidase inhibitor family I36 protein n=1 Tax=Actinoplanes sp. URMC 104 TaxID=3423409 RepID=UPI003F1983FF